MSDLAVWLILALAFVLTELMTGTFYLLVMAVAAVGAASAAFLQHSTAVQLGLGAVIALIGTGIVRLWRLRYRRPSPASGVTDPGVFLDIGQAVWVPAWDGARARIRYRGSDWDVQAAPGFAPLPGQWTISSVEGSTLILKPKNQTGEG